MGKILTSQETEFYDSWRSKHIDEIKASAGKTGLL